MFCLLPVRMVINWGNNKLFCWGLCFICSNASQENWFDHMKLKVYGKLPGKNKVKWQTLMVEVLFVQSHITQKHIYCIKREYFQIGILKLSQTKWLKEIKKSFFLLLLEGSLPVAISFIPNTNFLACVLLTAAYNVYKYDLIHLAIKPL